MVKVEQNVGSVELTANQLADILGVTRRHVDNLIQKGLPKTGERNKLRFNGRKALEWFRNYEKSLEKPKEAEITKDSNLPEAELRKMNAEATLKELKVQQQIGKLVAVEDVIYAQSQVNGNIRARLLSMPSKVAQRFNGAERARIKAVIEKEVLDTLNELAVETTSGIEFPELTGE